MVYSEIGANFFSDFDLSKAFVKYDNSSKFTFIFTKDSVVQNNFWHRIDP